MKIEKAVEKIVLTKREATILEKAYDIIMDIRDSADTIASDYADTVMDAMSDLIGNPERQAYTIGYEEENEDKQVVFIAVEI